MILKLLLNTSNDIDHIYKNIEEHNPNKKRKILIVFNNKIPDVLSNKTLNQAVTELFIRGRNLNICLLLLHNFFLLFQKILD